MQQIMKVMNVMDTKDTKKLNHHPKSQIEATFSRFLSKQTEF